MISRKIGNYFFLDDLLDSNVINNLEQVRLESLNLDYDYYENKILQQDKLKNEDNAIKVCKMFIDWLYNGKYNMAFKDFLNKSKSTTENDDEFSNTPGFVAAITNKKRIKQIGLPAPDCFYNIAICAHEFAHYLNFKYAAKMYDDYLLREVPSILLESLFTEYCIEHNYFKEFNDLRKRYIYECVARFLYMPKDSFNDIINNDFKDDDFMYSYLLNDALYYFGYIYSNQIREYYLDDEKTFKRRINGLFQGDKLEDLLEYYNINMRDDKTIDTTLKLIRSIK